MRCSLAAAFLFLSSSAYALPQGLTVERRGSHAIAHVDGKAMKELSRSTFSLDGTWSASLKIDEQIHNFPVEIGQFPPARYVHSFMFRQPVADGTLRYGSGFSWEDESTILFLPQWEGVFYFCVLPKVEDKFEGDCEGEDKTAHLILKPMNGEHPFRFMPVVASTNLAPAKDEDVGMLLFNSPQTAVAHNYAATVTGADELFMSFAVVHENKRGLLGIGGVLDVKAGLQDPQRFFVPYFLTALDGMYAQGRLTGVTKAEKLSASPLIIHASNEASGLHHTIFEPEN